MLNTRIIKIIFIVFLLCNCNFLNSKEAIKSINPGKYSKITVLNFSHNLSKKDTSSFYYGKSIISIYSFKRGLEEDSETSTSTFEEIEKSVLENPDNIKSYFFNDQIKKIVLNNKTWVDSVEVSAFDVSDRRIIRVILSSTDDYFFTVCISPQEKYESLIFSETPNYFLKQDNGSIIWDYKNKKSKLFAKNIVSGNLESNLGNEWYKESTEIMNTLKIE
jgi:hypothetical protein